MLNFLVHTPINTRAYVLDHLKSYLEILKKELGEELNIYSPSHNHSESWLVKGIEENTIPEIILCHASDLLDVEYSKALEIFSRGISNIYKENLEDDSQGYFKSEGDILFPIFIVPVVLCYNKLNASKEEFSNSWEDIFNKSEKVAFPDKDTPISKTVLAYLKKNFPDKYDDFLTRVNFLGSPTEVIQGLSSGEYTMGISNMSFSKMAKQKNIEVIDTKEGTISLPQVLVWKKGYDEVNTKISKALLGKDLHKYINQQGFVSTLEENSVGEKKYKLIWNGWNDYFNMLRNL